MLITCGARVIAFGVGVLAVMSWPASAAYAQAAAAEPPAAITIELNPSSSQPVAGAGFGVVGVIKNVSAQTIYVRELDLALTLPLELEGARGQVYGYAAYFATEPHDADSNKPYAEYFNHVVAIGPGEAYQVFWAKTSSGSADSGLGFLMRQVQSQIQFLFFRPGDYTIAVNAKYWTDGTLPPQGYRTATTNLTLPVAAPQFVILFGAAVGGLIAFFLLPPVSARRARARAGSGWARFAQRFFGAAAAVLLSVIITILISRMAGTQFVITVTVNDLWGAIAIGFAANYGGGKILDQIRRRESTSADDGARVHKDEKPKDEGETD